MLAEFWTIKGILGIVFVVPRNPQENIAIFGKSAIFHLRSDRQTKTADMPIRNRRLIFAYTVFLFKKHKIAQCLP